jgi:hypothetical protein
MRRAESSPKSMTMGFPEKIPSKKLDLEWLERFRTELSWSKEMECALKVTWLKVNSLIPLCFSVDHGMNS